MRVFLRTRKRPAVTARRMTQAAIVFMFLAWTTYLIVGPGGLATLRERQREQRALEREVQELKQHNERLVKRQEALRRDPKAMEKVAREEMKYSRPGEVVYTLPKR
jgi:cell division protein FtsB